MNKKQRFLGATGLSGISGIADSKTFNNSLKLYNHNSFIEDGKRVIEIEKTGWKFSRVKFLIDRLVPDTKQWYTLDLYVQARTGSPQIALSSELDNSSNHRPTSRKGNFGEVRSDKVTTNKFKTPGNDLERISYSFKFWKDQINDPIKLYLYTKGRKGDSFYIQDFEFYAGKAKDKPAVKTETAAPSGKQQIMTSSTKSLVERIQSPVGYATVGGAVLLIGGAIWYLNR
ncbi:MAG: hypothetical protein ACQETE_01595 [Bacteroidota bacterium]